MLVSGPINRLRAGVASGLVQEHQPLERQVPQVRMDKLVGFLLHGTDTRSWRFTHRWQVC